MICWMSNLSSAIDLCKYISESDDSNMVQTSWDNRDRERCGTLYKCSRRLKRSLYSNEWIDSIHQRASLSLVPWLSVGLIVPSGCPQWKQYWMRVFVLNAICWALQKPCRFQPLDRRTHLAFADDKTISAAEAGLWLPLGQSLTADRTDLLQINKSPSVNLLTLLVFPPKCDRKTASSSTFRRLSLPGCSDGLLLEFPWIHKS